MRQILRAIHLSSKLRPSAYRSVTEMVFTQEMQRVDRELHLEFAESPISEVKPWSQGWLIAAGAYPGFCRMKRLKVFLLPLDGMLVHRRTHPRNFVRFPQQIAGTHLYAWVERGTMRVKCLAQEHNTLSPARARTRTARSGVKRTNHEATAPLTRIPDQPCLFSHVFTYSKWLRSLILPPNKRRGALDMARIENGSDADVSCTSEWTELTGLGVQVSSTST